MFEVWDELWSKSRKMITNRSFRRKSPKVNKKHVGTESTQRKEFKSRIPVLQKYGSTYIQTTDLDKSDPIYSEITHYSEQNCDEFTPKRPKYRKHGERIRSDIPEYIRKSYAKNNKCLDPHYSNVDNSHIYGTLNNTYPERELVTCHIYETLPKKKYFPRETWTSSEDEAPQPEIINECAVIHPSPVLTKFHPEECTHAKEVATTSLKTSELIKDEQGVFLSPILTKEQLRIQKDNLISPPQAPQEKACRKNLEHRFVVNTFRASAWQRLSRREKPSLDAPQLIQVCERLDSGIHSDSSSDNEKNQQMPPSKQDINIVRQISTDSESNYASSSTTAGNECKSQNSSHSDIGFVGELYRARITPERILARNLKLRQRRVPSRLLNMFEDMSTSEVSDSPTTPEEIISFLDKEASKLEDEIIKHLDEEETKIHMNSTEVVYATPLKINKSSSNEQKKDAENRNQITEEINEMLNSPIKSDSEKAKTDSSVENETFMKLKEEADYQCKIMRQASKALEVSRKSDSFVDVRPQVEAEKILLTASCRYEKVLQDIRHTHYEKPVESKQIGSVQISNFSIGLSKLSEEQTGWVVLILMDDKRIFSTTPLEINQHQHKIKFDQTFLFDNLNGNFEITGKIYCLPRRECEKSLKRSESRLSNKLRLSGRKLRYMDLYTKDPVENNIITSSFIPMGYFKVSVNDINTSKSSCIDKKLTMYENSPFNGQVQMDINLAQIKISMEKIGMLNVRSSTNPVVWNRRWCTLSGTVMKFWNSPLDESFKDPLMIIDLVYCQQDIENAKREVCPRPKTLSIVTSKETFYLNIDTIVELREWKKNLNDVYKGLKDWKLLRE